MLYINRLTGRLEYMPEVIASGVGYVHPLTHPASMIVEETNRRFMTDAEKAKLAGIADGANNYIHPASHPASMVVEETDKRFMTDGERTKLTGIAVGATNTPLGNTAPAALATSGSAGTSGSASRVDHVHPLPAVATSSANGLMASSDKSKLDGVAAGANNYVHPATHPASMIQTDSNRRFVTDAYISSVSSELSRRKILEFYTVGASGLSLELWGQDIYIDNAVDQVVISLVNPQDLYTGFLEIVNLNHYFVAFNIDLGHINFIVPSSTDEQSLFEGGFKYALFRYFSDMETNIVTITCLFYLP